MLKRSEILADIWIYWRRQSWAELGIKHQVIYHVELQRTKNWNKNINHVEMNNFNVSIIILSSHHNPPNLNQIMKCLEIPTFHFYQNFTSLTFHSPYSLAFDHIAWSSSADWVCSVAMKKFRHSNFFLLLFWDHFKVFSPVFALNLTASCGRKHRKQSE